jgi:omega-amidase
LNIRLAEIPIQRSWGASMNLGLRAAEIKPVPDVLILPELFTIGFVLNRIAESAITEEQLATLPLAAAARENGTWIVGGSFPVKTSRGIVNMLPVYDPEGKLVHTTEKTHLFRYMGENTVFTPGNPAGVFNLKGIPAGASVCYDLRFPELFRRHVLKGAEILLLPAQWPQSRIELFRSLLVARSAEAQVFTVGCNLGGDHLGVSFKGGGGVSHPSGKLLEGSPIDEYTRDFKIERIDVTSIREKINCIEDRRPEVYGGGE